MPVVILIALASFAIWFVAADYLRPILVWGAGFLPWVDPMATTPVLSILAVIGLLHPMTGVIAMTMSSLSVIGNSLLLKRVKLNASNQPETE
ncbi:hypothetical protein [Saccharospirillum impatiens]|uniref:hypothetical protein n=1 Tax=Saccharospirillum impatiens TaxID=169438 RepID=UPI001FDF2512|nr:hypothetical protein [Saccharospirillum impatiens]